MRGGKEGEPEKGKSPRTFWLLQALLLLLILIAAFLLFSPLSPMGIRSRHISHMEQKVRSLGELVTVNQIFRDVIYREERRLISDKRVLFSMDFHIKAGFRLDNAQVSLDRSGVPTILLDPPVVLSVDADELSINQIFIRQQFAQIHQSDYMEVIVEEKERLHQEALERGLLSKARQQGELLIGQIFRMAGYDEYIIEIREEL